jgi:hypothetical protein
MFLLISWRWVRNVVAVIATTRTPARICTLTSVASVNVSEIGAPKIFALRSWSTCLAVRTRGWPLRGLVDQRNSARKIGIWMISGRHEANGLVPVSL